MKIFAERLRELRLERGLTQQELAQAIKLTQGAITHWERADRVPNADAVVALAKFFGVSADYLLGMTEQ